MSNGKGKIKKDDCSDKHKEFCKKQGKVAYYDKKENKCGCKKEVRDAKGKVISIELIKK